MEDGSFQPQANDEGTAWVHIILNVIMGALTVKASSLWSESRILRKLKFMRNWNVENTESSSAGLQAFSAIYISLSKGRHRELSKCYLSLYVLTIGLIDIMSDVLHRTGTNIYLEGIDSLTTFRILISVSSLAILGARPLEKREYIPLSLFVCMYASSLFAFGTAALQALDNVPLSVIRYVLYSVQLICSTVYGVQNARGRGSDLASIVDLIERDVLEKGSKQYKRLEEMSRLAGSTTDMAKETRQWKYWFSKKQHSYDLFVFIFFQMTNAIVWGEVDRSMLPNVIILECMEMISIFLLMINEIEVEPTLFVELLRRTDVVDLHGDNLEERGVVLNV